MIQRALMVGAACIVCVALWLLLADTGVTLPHEPESSPWRLAHAQDAGEESEDEDESDEDDEGDEEDDSGFTDEEEEAICEMFTTSSADFTGEGRLKLVYDFETMKEELLVDWMPDMDTFKNRLRWSRGAEGTFSTIEHGIVIGDHGMWLHKARWKNLRMEVFYLSMAGSRRGDLLSAVFAYDKRKRIVGSNMGRQCVRLKGTKLAGKPIPTDWPILTAERKFEFGFELENGVLSALERGSPRATTDDKKKFLKKLGPGHAGLVWKGSIQGFIFKIVLEGELDPDWVKEQ